MNHVARRARRSIVVLAGVAGAMLSTASLAWACTLPSGQTFFTDATISKSAALGSRISAFGTGANTNVAYKLVIGEDGPHPNHACMVTDFTVNNTVRMSSSDGFIGPTAGPAGDANLPKNTYQVCFTDYLYGNVSTSAATLTII
jgi:hypothetical protein